MRISTNLLTGKLWNRIRSTQLTGMYTWRKKCNCPAVMLNILQLDFRSNFRCQQNAGQKKIFWMKKKRDWIPRNPYLMFNILQPFWYASYYTWCWRLISFSIWFRRRQFFLCKKINTPYRVYNFTTPWRVKSWEIFISLTRLWGENVRMPSEYLCKNGFSVLSNSSSLSLFSLFHSQHNPPPERNPHKEYVLSALSV